MKLNKFFMLGLAGLAFAACSNDDEPSVMESSKEKSVEVSIANATYGTPGTRKEATDGFSKGDIAVADAANLKFLLLAGERIQAVKTTKDATTKQGAKGNIYTFHNVDGSVNGLAIIGNTNVTINANSNYNDVLNSIKKEANLTSQQGALNNIVVFGKNTQWKKKEADDQGHTDAVYSAGEITVNPLLARLEVGEIGCKNLGDQATEGAIPLYKELTLEKIGLDNIKTDFSQTNLLAYSDDDAGEKLWTAATTWVDNLTDVLTNAQKNAAGTYAYNVVPGTTPRIILEIASYKANDNVEDPNAKFPWYVRANQYTGLNGTFEAGKIYQVKFQFNCDNIKPWHPVQPICVEVEVVIPNWTIVELTPEFQ